MFVHDVVYKQAVARVEQFQREAARDHAVAALRPGFRARFAADLHRLAERLEPDTRLDGRLDGRPETRLNVR